MMKPLEQRYGLERWDDSRIRTGMVWREEIEKALASAQVALLMVSTDFLASDFVMRKDLSLTMPNLLARIQMLSLGSGQISGRPWRGWALIWVRHTPDRLVGYADCLSYADRLEVKCCCRTFQGEQSQKSICELIRLSLFRTSSLRPGMAMRGCQGTGVVQFSVQRV